MKNLDDIIRDMQSKKLVEIQTKSKHNLLLSGRGRAKAVFDMLNILATTVKKNDSLCNFDEWLYTNWRN